MLHFDLARIISQTSLRGFFMVRPGGLPEKLQGLINNPRMVEATTAKPRLVWMDAASPFS